VSLVIFRVISCEQKKIIGTAPIMATEVGDNYDSLLKEMETLKGRLEEERLKLNDVACKF